MKATLSAIGHHIADVAKLLWRVPAVQSVIVTYAVRAATLIGVPAAIAALVPEIAKAFS